MTFWKPIGVLLSLRRCAAANDFAENPTAFLGRGLLALILALAGMSMASGLGAHWGELSDRAAASEFARLMLIAQVFCLLGMLVPGAVMLLGGNPPQPVLRAFPLSPLQRFVADLPASLLDAPAAIVAVSILPFLARLLVGGEFLQTLATVVMCALVAVQTCALVRVLTDVAALLTRRLRRWAEIPAFTGLLLVCLCGVVPPAFASLTTAKAEVPGAIHFVKPPAPSADPTPLLPSTCAGSAMQAIRLGDLPGAAGSLLMLLTIACATVGAGFGASRAAALLPNDARSSARSSSALRLPTQGVGLRDGPLWQLAALVVAEWRLLVRKPESYLPLRRPAAMVLLGVLAFLASDMGKDPVYSIKELLGLGGVLYTVLWQIQLLCNRFGSESGTATLLFSLSIPKARLLLGKNLALLMLLLLLDSITLAALCVVSEAPGNIPAFLVWQALALIVITGIGNIVSIVQPFSIARHDSRNKEDAPDGLAAAYVAIGVATGFLLWPVTGMVGSGPLGVAAGFGYALLLYGILLPASAAMLRRYERTVIARLDRSGQ